MQAKIVAFFLGLSPTTYAFVGVFVLGLCFGGCAGCSCEKHRPHIIVKDPPSAQ